MEKRVIIFLIVSLAVIIGYDYLLKGMGLLPPPEPVQMATNPNPATITDAPAGTTGDSTKSESSAPVSSLNVASAASGNGTAAASEEQTIEVDTELFRAKFSNRGAVLKSWELKRYSA
ncbi:MAG: hypothetical protein KA426_19605, partial [Nitrospira sp.]|nr:hypothetical protein [Nitrospira sp.]